MKIGYSDRGAPGGRRRRKSHLENILENVNTHSRLDKRSVEDELDVEGGVSYIAMEYIKFFTDNIGNIRNTKLSKSSDQKDLLAELLLLHEKLSAGDELAGRISRVLAVKLMMMISD